jgi:ferredoxin
MYKTARERLTELFGAIAEKMPLYLPVQGDAGLNFACWQKNIEKVDLQALKTTLSPKGFFLPAIEGLYTTVQKDNRCEITPQPTADKPFALFGIRACDAAALEILDSVFLTDPVDTFYKARREAACIITLACEKPGATCFCGSFDISPAEPGGDIAAWLTEDSLHWQPLTKKGEALTAQLKLSNILQKHENEAVSRNENPCTETLTIFKDKNIFIPSLFDSPAWDDLHRTCITCGTCTFVCPTCQCYDIATSEADEIDEPVHCHRHWDACLYPAFTQMAHGNPRPTQKERFRQRFMHKLVYHQQKYGVFGCVGCGRCVNNCPININIVKVATTLCASPPTH